MHELSVCQSMLELIQQRARTDGFDRVKTVYLEMGALACVEPESLRFCFDTVCRGTLLDGAELSIEQIAAHAWCCDCGQEVQVVQRLAPCPNCGAFGLLPRDGEQMRVNRLEVY